jgi:hypothetical protein
MADLLTTATLAKWTQNDPAEVAADEFAVDLIDKVSQLICWIGGHDGNTLDAAGDPVPEWTLDAGPDQAPIDVQMVALQVIKRSYENPEQIIQAGNIGPLGGDRHADVYALFADFTEAERATIAKYNLDGDPEAIDDGAFIFVLETTRGDGDTLPEGSPLYVGDDQQINLEFSDDPREWKIPMFNPGDPGDDLNYEE